MMIGNWNEAPSIDLEELCDICHISPDFLEDLIAYGIIHTATVSSHERKIFQVQAVQRVQTVLRLQQDLEINLAGIALVLDLLDELEELRAAKRILEKHLLR